MVKNAIGINFEFSREYVNHFAQLFENISVERYTWYVSCSENFCSNNGKWDSFLPNGIYSGNEFFSIISSISEYYIHLICLFAVPRGKIFDLDKINDYEDYVKSNAEIALLSADSIVDLYVKDENVLNTIINSCIYYYSSNTKIPKIITHENNVRNKFWV